jgi:integrase
MSEFPLSIYANNPALEELVAKRAALVSQAKAVSTQAAYQKDWSIFERFSATIGMPALPSTPDCVALFVAQCVADSLAISTISRRLAAITARHKAAGYVDSPASTRNFIVAEVLKGARRVRGIAQVQKDPLAALDLLQLIKACPDTILGMRDRALCLFAFASGCRASELVQIGCEDLKWSVGGVEVFIPRSKNDQEKHGRTVAIPYGIHEKTCPVRALKDWLIASSTSSGSVFRAVNRHQTVSPRQLSPDSVSTILRTALARTGRGTDGIASHSFRAGFVTTCHRNGISEPDIARQTGHRSAATLRRYIREQDRFQNNPAAALGL